MAKRESVFIYVGTYPAGPHARAGSQRVEDQHPDMEFREVIDTGQAILETAREVR